MTRSAAQPETLLAVVGPTAVGKTRLSLELAPRLGAEILSVDSAQVYRGMDIGTDKPSAGQRRQVRHHLIDVVEPSHSFSVAEYRELATAAIADMRGRGVTPLLVGGSGLYFQAIVDPLEFPARQPEQEVRRSLEEAAAADRAALWRRLREVDPDAAAAIPPENARRVVRALEVYEITGVPFSRHQGKLFSGGGGYDLIAAGVTAERTILTAVIEDRVREMLDAGLLDEVRRLAAHEMSPTARQAIGYRQLLEFLDRGGDLEEYIRKAEQATRRLAKRQMTWFRRDHRITWFTLESADATSAARLEGQVLDYFQGELAKRQKGSRR
ncbi:MAG: tRNA (adenosine(37)-N6)-dimethylallyltransferase MiaA [Candidatus Geothermincolia bacterium]